MAKTYSLEEAVDKLSCSLTWSLFDEEAPLYFIETVFLLKGSINMANKKKYSLEEVIDIIKNVIKEYGIQPDTMLIYYIRKCLK